MTPPLDPARQSYRAISLYAPNRAPARVDLSDNTNLWGVPPAAARAIAEAAAGAAVTRYPNLYAAELKDRKSTRLNYSHANISYAVFCLKKKKIRNRRLPLPDPHGLHQYHIEP